MKLSSFYKNSSIIISFSLILLSVFSCQKDIKDLDAGAKVYIDQIMDQHYFWYKDMPQNISKTDRDVYKYFEDHKVEKDRWSWMESAQEWKSSETGTYTSYGVVFGQPIEFYQDYSIMVRYVYPNSPLFDKGVKRGWTLTHLNNVEVMTLLHANKYVSEISKDNNTFTFRDEKGVSHTFTASKRTISTRSYLTSTVFTDKDFNGLVGKVGYFNYLTFNANMLSDIEGAFNKFKNEGVTDVILDMRYNGGGNIIATECLANYLAPLNAEGEVLVRRQHNDKNRNNDDKNISKIKRTSGSLNLNRLFVISGRGTASASEIIINGLKPFFGENLITVGDTTYGKPNGMYLFAYPLGTSKDYYANAEYVFLPICFYSVNKNGEGNYEKGILPTKYWPDDLYSDWGPNEGIIKACLTYISSGAYPNLPPKRTSEELSQKIKSRSKIEFPEDAPSYGRCVIY